MFSLAGRRRWAFGDAIGAKLVPERRLIPVETIDEIDRRLREPARVVLQRGRGSGMPELCSDVGDGRTLGEQRGREGVAQIVKTMAADLSPLHGARETLADAADIERVAGAPLVKTKSVTSPLPAPSASASRLR